MFIIPKGKGKEKALLTKMDGILPYLGKFGFLYAICIHILMYLHMYKCAYTFIEKKKMHKHVHI